MRGKLKKKASSALLVISTLLLLNTCVASKQNIVGGGLNKTSINGFLWQELNNEDQVSDLEGSLYNGGSIVYPALNPDKPVPGSPKPGLPYSRGCPMYYMCR